MKDLVMKNRVINFDEDARLQHCSVVSRWLLVQTKEDLGAFTVPCFIWIMYFVMSLCDLGANINLMPFSIYKILV